MIKPNSGYVDRGKQIIANEGMIIAFTRALSFIGNSFGIPLVKSLEGMKFRASMNIITINLCRIFKSDKVYGHPYKLTVETGNLCNLRCALCPMRWGSKTDVPRGFLSFKVFKKTIDELGKYLIEIDLFNWGEPFLNKDIFKIIKYAESKKIAVTVSSNLTYSNKDYAKKIVDSGLSHLIVSLDGASQETAEKYKRGTNFERVIKNMAKITEVKKKFNKKRPVVTWRILVNKYNENDIPRARELAKSLGVAFSLGCIRCDTAKEIFMSLAEQYENIRPWLPSDERYSMYDYSKRRKKMVLCNDCSFLWTQSVINWDGSVLPCCTIFDPIYKFGNMLETPFRAIWNNEKYTSSRRLIAGGNSAIKTICNTCHNHEAMI